MRHTLTCSNYSFSNGVMYILVLKSKLLYKASLTGIIHIIVLYLWFRLCILCR